MGLKSFLIIFLAARLGIAERNEVEALKALERAGDALTQRSLATQFVREYPASRKLAQVYAVAAQASFRLGDAATGLYYARDSLRIYPENAVLHATLAAVRANRGEAAQAKQHARAALRYLRIFQKPAGMTENQWAGVRERLRETASRVLGEEAAPVRLALKPQPRSEYAGTPACQPCHKAEFAAWEKTGMARMLRHAAPENIAADFSQLQRFREGAFQPARGVVEKGRHYIELQKPNGMFQRYAVDAVIGSKWQQAFATRAPNGELHVAPIQYSLLEKRWLNYWRVIDPPASERADILGFHQFREVTAYQSNCAPCHTSQWGAKESKEYGINCEMCHGPGAEHARGAKLPWSFKRMTAEESVGVCAQCHAQSAQRIPQQAFPPQYQRRPYTEFDQTKAFYADGRFRETTFLVEAFERSACYREGKATCASCHDVHPRSGQGNAKSLRFEEKSDVMCTQCHAEGYGTKAHTRHEDVRCADCHMPKIMNALLFRAGNHQIDDIPNAAATARFGVDESPNACLDCHAGKPLDWLKTELGKFGRGLNSP
jgi:hypothetical protein